MTDRPARSRRGTLAGQVVAGHELVRVLAAGGMGEVYLARHQTLGVERAVKVIRTDLRTRDHAHERFVREAQVLARLQHNSIVQIIDFGQLPNGWPYLIMEYVDGPNLDQLVDAGPLPLPSALRVLEQIAIALHHAHKLGVIHRDLKPSNVLLRGGDVRQVKLIDFGLALTAGVDRLTAEGHSVGSPLYMAPEQVAGELDITPAADVYGLAGIAYTLMSGRPPFHGMGLLQLHAAHSDETPPRLAERCPGIPALLDGLLYACLAKDPARRPHCDELAAHFGRLAHDAEGPGTPRSPGPNATPGTRQSAARSVVTLLLDSPPPGDDVAAALATQVMAVIGELAAHLSGSDPELAHLLREEDDLRETLTDIELELAVVTSLLEAPSLHDLTTLTGRRQALELEARALRARQRRLQRRLIESVEVHRPQASGPAVGLFHEIDRAVERLDALHGEGT